MGSVPVAATFAIKRNARRPYLRVFVKNEAGTAFDFTGAASVTFLMYDVAGIEVISAAAIIEAPATTGVLAYQWAAGDTNVSGEFRAEFDVDYGGGEILTVPVRGNILIRIYDDLNNA